MCILRSSLSSMDQLKRKEREDRITTAAEKVFARDGFQLAKMSDIAEEAGMTKVTLYSYFQSKENLYLAIIYKAFQSLTEIFYTTIGNHQSSTGLEATIAIFDSFFDFCEQNFLYSEAILDYFSLIRDITRSTDNSGTPSLQNNIYFVKIQDLQNLPIKLTIKEIRRGQQDGSIADHIDPTLHTIQGWTMVVGYIKLLIASGQNDLPLFDVNLKSLRSLSLNLAKKALQGLG